MENNDSDLALLVSVFPDIDITELAEILKEQDVHAAIDTLLKPRPANNKNDLLKFNALFHNSISASPKLILNHANIHKHLPCTLSHEFLPLELASELLDCMLAESHSWTTRKFNLFDRDVVSPHTTCFYYDPEITFKTLPDTDYQSERREFPLILKKIASLVENHVHESDKNRSRQSTLEVDLNEWHPNIVIANCYKGHQQGVGAHSDRLTFIGPLPTIASLTLGATRTFRISSIQEKQKFDILLPHNSLLIMNPPMQVYPCKYNE